MINKLLSTLLVLLPIFSYAQPARLDSLVKAFKTAANDSLKYQISGELHSYYENTNSDSANFYIEAELLLAARNKKKLAEATALIARAYQRIISMRYAASLQDLLKAFSVIEKVNVEKNNWIHADPEKAKLLTLALAHHIYATLMTPTQNAEQQIFHYKQALALGKMVNNPTRIILANLGLGRTYLDLNRLDSALLFEQEAERIAIQSGQRSYLAAVLSYSGLLHLKKNNKELARQAFYRGIREGIESGNKGGLAQNYFQLTNYYLEENDKDSALFYAVKFQKLMEILGSVSLSTVDKGMAYENVYRAFELNNKPDSAYKYQGLALSTKSTLYKARINSLAEFQNLSFREQMRLQNMERENEARQNRIIGYAMLCGLFVFALVTFILYRNNKQKQQANRVLNDTLSNLKSTQAQLIQSEKMASLGELTAGIAHEIQNPLNFVNNFSEVSREMLDEMREAIEKGDTEEAREIMHDVIQNLEKINHHGKRADGIIKGMLQHSRSSSGQKEQTDINALADEYLRLAYHGLRAKDKSFNVTLKTDYDESIGNINIIPQDIGRVILNLITNAFYAIAEKKRNSSPGYEPIVTLSTKLLKAPSGTSRPDSDRDREGGLGVSVSVKDNGNGIPQEVLDKIFQPFFTTKPTGQGTGLGLSLSYDIVKANGGDLKVETREGEGSEFIFQLPAA